MNNINIYVSHVKIESALVRYSLSRKPSNSGSFLSSEISKKERAKNKFDKQLYESDCRSALLCF